MTSFNECASQVPGFRPKFILAAGFKPMTSLDKSDDYNINSSSNEESDATDLSGYSKGFSEGYAKAQIENHRDVEAKLALSNSLNLITNSSESDILKVLWKTVSKLVVEAVGSASVDSDLIRSRCSEALSMIEEKRGEAILYVAETDLQIVKDLETEVAIEIDPKLLSGSVRLTHLGGEIVGGTVRVIERIEEHIATLGGEYADI